jgi:PAS domain S-box-containing protein
VAAAAAVLPLLLLSWGWPAGSGPPAFPLQGNLLTQCSIALLAAASAGWIRASEARYRRVVGGIPVVLTSYRLSAFGDRHAADSVLPLADSRQPIAEFISPACRELLGCAPEQLLGGLDRWLERVHPSDREILLAAVAQLERQSQPVTCEYRLAPDPGKAAGQERWVRDTLAPHHGPDGRLEGWEGVLTDITEQRLLAGDLRRTTGMLHALVAHLPAGVFFVQGRRPILVNARARQLLGPQEALSNFDELTSVYRLCRPDGTPYPFEELPVTQALRHGRTSMRDDIVVHRSDGRRLSLVTWAAPIDLGGSGQPAAAVWVLEDASALRQAEAALRASEARLRAVIETMAEGLIVQDQHGAIVESNPAACAILGLPPAQLHGRSLADPERPCLREDGTPLPAEEQPALVSLRTGQPVRNLILGVPRPVGEPGASATGAAVRWILANSMPLPPADRRAAPRAVTTFADITAYRQALDVVRASEEKYRGLVESLPLGLVQGDRDGRVTYMNPALHELAGYTVDEVRLPAVWNAVVSADDVPRLHDIFAAVLRGQTERVEVRFRARDGMERHAYIIALPCRHGDAITGATFLVVDVTRERRLEQDLQRSQRVELVGRLASGIAHDFNNLLTVILALADLSRTKLPADHPVRHDLGSIAEAGEQAVSLTSQLMALSKNRRITYRPVDINDVARRTLELLHSSLARNIAVEARLSDGALNVLGDETQLQQVLMNLCLNARDAMPRGGRLRVETAVVRSQESGVRSQQSVGEWVRLSVQDTGEGVPEGLREHIFDPFFSTKERGCGLGLAVVQQIVAGSGGRVEIHSGPSEGARFDVWLPCASDSRPVPAATRETEAACAAQ